MLRKPRSLAALVVASLCLLGALPHAARASFPGRPGVIVFNLISVNPPAETEPTGGLYSVQPNGTELRQLTTNPRDYEPSFSPSGKWLAFRHFGPNADEGLYVLDMRTGKPMELASGQGDQNAAFGRRGMIAFTRFVDHSYDLFVRLRNDRLRRLTKTSVATEDDPVFTPNGTRIVFTRHVERNAYSGEMQLAIQPAWQPLPK